MSMIEHAVGVVSLDRFAELAQMDHDEMGALLLDTMAENAKLRELLDGCAILLTDSDFMHWPELRDETLQGMRELGVEVNV